MGDCKVIGIAERNAIYKANSGGIRFKMRTAGRSPEIILISAQHPYISLYKLTFGHETKVLNLREGQEVKFPSSNLISFLELREFYLTWYCNKIKIGLIGEEKPFVDYVRILNVFTEPSIGFIQFKTVCRHTTPVEWIIETSPIILKSVPRKNFNDRPHWFPMINGKLPPDAMIGGFENELTYIARSEHNNSLCPGKYLPSKGLAYVPWGHREHAKQQFEILCGYNAKWVKTESNFIPMNAFIGGHSELQCDPLFIGRAMIEGRLICGKVHVRYNLCYLPVDGKEIEVSAYEILVMPDYYIPHAIPCTIADTPADHH